MMAKKDLIIPWDIEPAPGGSHGPAPLSDVRKTLDGPVLGPPTTVERSSLETRRTTDLMERIRIRERTGEIPDDRVKEL